MKRIVFFVIMIMITHTASAQLIDTMGGLGIAGTMTKSSMGMMQNALHSAEAQDIMNKIRLEVIDYKSKVRNYYNNTVKPEARKIPLLAKYEGKIESSAHDIIVTLFHVKQFECEQMVQLGAKIINLNGGEYKPILCNQDNLMKFIFE